MSAKAYLTVDSQNAKFVTALGNMCSVTEQLPTSAVLTAGLKKRGKIAVASGGLTDIWRGKYRGTLVAIKAFRIHPSQDLKEAKKVHIQLTWETCSQTQFTDSVDTGTHVEEAISRKYPPVSRGGHVTLSACTCL